MSLQFENNWEDMSLLSFASGSLSFQSVPVERTQCDMGGAYLNALPGWVHCEGCNMITGWGCECGQCVGCVNLFPWQREENHCTCFQFVSAQQPGFYVPAVVEPQRVVVDLMHEELAPVAYRKVHYETAFCTSHLRVEVVDLTRDIGSISDDSTLASEEEQMSEVSSISDDSTLSSEQEEDSVLLSEDMTDCWDTSSDWLPSSQE